MEPAARPPAPVAANGQAVIGSGINTRAWVTRAVGSATRVVREPEVISGSVSFAGRCVVRVSPPSHA